MVKATPVLHVGGLYSSVGQSARLVSARSGVRTSLEAIFWALHLVKKPAKCCCKKLSPSLWLGPPTKEGRARRGSNTRPLDLQSNALPTAPQAPGVECGPDFMVHILSALQLLSQSLSGSMSHGAQSKFSVVQCLRVPFQTMHYSLH